MPPFNFGRTFSNAFSDAANRASQRRQNQQERKLRRALSRARRQAQMDRLSKRLTFQERQRELDREQQQRQFRQSTVPVPRSEVPGADGEGTVRLQPSTATTLEQMERSRERYLANNPRMTLQGKNTPFLSEGQTLSGRVGMDSLMQMAAQTMMAGGGMSREEQSFSAYTTAIKGANRALRSMPNVPGIPSEEELQQAAPERGMFDFSEPASAEELAFRATKPVKPKQVDRAIKGFAPAVKNLVIGGRALQNAGPELREKAMPQVTKAGENVLGRLQELDRRLGLEIKRRRQGGSVERAARRAGLDMSVPDTSATPQRESQGPRMDTSPAMMAKLEKRRQQVRQMIRGVKRFGRPFPKGSGPSLEQRIRQRGLESRFLDEQGNVDREQLRDMDAGQFIDLLQTTNPDE